MNKIICKAFVITSIIFLLTGLQQAHAADPEITILEEWPSEPVGYLQCLEGPNCWDSAPWRAFQPYNFVMNVAYQGGPALPAVAKDVLANSYPWHLPANANDGNYGNGRSWIPNSSNSWLKIHLGKEVLIDHVLFGRDRRDLTDAPPGETLSWIWNDRDPEQFIIEYALVDTGSCSDGTGYCAGDESNDSIEYTQILDSGVLVSDYIEGDNTVKVTFDPILAKYVKFIFISPANCNDGSGVRCYVAIDEVEIHKLAATVDIDPDTLNLKSKGKWITCYIELPEGYYVEEIDSVALTEINGNPIAPLSAVGPSELGDYDSDGILDLMVKFDRAAVQDSVSQGIAEVVVVNSLTSGVQIEGTDTMLVIDKGKEHANEEGHSSVDY